MLFTVSLYLSLAICIIGIIYRCRLWFRPAFDSGTGKKGFAERLRDAIKAIVPALLSKRFFSLGSTLFLDVFFQRSIFRQSISRWIMHICIFYGFVLLVFLHAMDAIVTERLFTGYVSTLNPFFFLRNLFCLMVLIGIGMALVRRIFHAEVCRVSGSRDFLPILFIGSVLLSGVLLEASQIVSEPIFDEMVTDYLGSDDEAEIVPLKAYWEKHYGVVFGEPVHSDDPNLLENGREIHMESCMGCHSRPDSAFLSFITARLIRPFAGFLNRIRADTYLWHIHYLIAFLGLAWLPFGKFFHMVSTPVNLLVRVGPKTMDSGSKPHADMGNLAMDACTHCGACSVHCKVAPVFRVIPNAAILPSEKLAMFACAVSGKKTASMDLERLAEGSHICTECGRCGEVCPSGIDLPDLWRVSKTYLNTAGFPEPHLWIRDRSATEWADGLSGTDPGIPESFVNLTDHSETFSGCIQCTVCTSVCPVVALVDDPVRELDLTPQQIMNLLRLEMKDTALGARMVWKCVTCYLCQEHCPQGVKVADVLYELRNIATRRLKPDYPVQSEERK